MLIEQPNEAWRWKHVYILLRFQANLRLFQFPFKQTKTTCQTNVAHNKGTKNDTGSVSDMKQIDRKHGLRPLR